MPPVPEGLDSVRVTRITPYGPLTVDRRGRSLHLEIPVGITATFRSAEYSCGTYDLAL